jgi:hypothetical protein
MPVSFVKPSMTDCGTYSDQAKRFSSSSTSAGAWALSAAGFALSGFAVAGFASSLFAAPPFASPVFASSCEVQAVNAAKGRRTARATQSFLMEVLLVVCGGADPSVRLTTPPFGLVDSAARSRRRGRPSPG